VSKQNRNISVAYVEVKNVGSISAFQGNVSFNREQFKLCCLPVPKIIGSPKIFNPLSNK